MKVHYIQHVDFETPGSILKWAETHQHTLTHTFLFQNETLPSPSDFDFLVIMGGPMNIYEYDKYPWLKEEKKFIELTLKSDKKLLGICLGAQLLADVLGAEVYKNTETEIGYFPVSLTNKALELKLFSDIPQTFTALHWHGDTFSVPDSAVKIAENSVTSNQGFLYNNQALALQFHLEADTDSLEALIKGSRSDLQKQGKYIQSEQDLRAKAQENFASAKKVLFSMLDNL